MTDTVLLVDGHNLLFQMFFGMPARITNRAGMGIWGVLGVVGALRKMVALVHPTHVAVLFDGEHESSRRDVLPTYKADRPDYGGAPPEENPFSQLPLVFRALEHLHIPYAETTDCEVDDWMASYAHRCREDCRMVIASYDSDFFQLIGEHVSVLRYRGDASQLCDAAYLREKYGVSPHRYADFKSLVGDKADNIRGADKIGVKTAARLLAEFGSLTEILAHAEQIQPRSVRESVLSSSERLRDNYRIIALPGDVPTPISLPDTVYAGGAFSTNEVLCAIGALP